jgi:hypothetical protein
VFRRLSIFPRRNYQNTNLASNVYYPLFAAVAYTFGFSIIRAGIKIYLAWVHVKSQNKIYDINYNSRSYTAKIDQLNAAHQVEMDKFEAAKSLLNSKAIESDNRLDEIHRYKEEINRINDQLRQALNTVETTNKANELNAMDGKWKVTGMFEARAEVWTIKHGKIYIADKHESTIEAIVADSKNGKSAMFYFSAMNIEKRYTIFFDKITADGFYSGWLADLNLKFEPIPG